MKELVSIVIPNYNKQKYLKETIESVLNQTYKNIEVIIVDDGSEDQSNDIISAYEKIDKRVRFHKRPHYGKIKTINFGIAQSTGSLIKIWGSDDYMYKKAIEELVSECVDVDIVAHNCSVTDEMLNITKEKFVDLKLYKSNKTSISEVIQGKGYPSGLYIMKRHVVDAIYPLHEKATYEDWYIYMMIISKKFTIKYYDQTLGLYRQVPNSAFGGVNNNSRSVVLYRMKRDITMLGLFMEILPEQYIEEVSKRLTLLRLSTDGTLREIIGFNTKPNEKIKIFIKRYFHTFYMWLATNFRKN